MMADGRVSVVGAVPEWRHSVLLQIERIRDSEHWPRRDSSVELTSLLEVLQHNLLL